jgi:uncharacterized protein YkwD
MIARKYWGALAALFLLATGARAGTLEDNVLAELNLARTHPEVYANRLRQYREWFSGRLVYVPGLPDPYSTYEGVSAVDDAIRFLDAQKPVGPLQPDHTLALAAGDWVEAQGPAGRIGHVSATGRGPGDRVTARGGDKYVGEHIAYGFNEADLVVVQLLVDDYVPNRSHRKTLYNPMYAYAGVACGPHAVYRHMCVIDYSFFPKGTFLATAHAAPQASQTPGRSTP